MNKTLTRIIAATAALGVLGGGALVVADLHKEPVLMVDGTETQVAGFFGDVEDVLKSQGIELGEHDTVAPSLDSGVQDGDLISVRYGRKLELVVDGELKTYWTTETDLAAALTSLGYDHNALGLSVEASRSLGREGLKVEVTTPKPVTFLYDGETVAADSLAKTVGEALTAQGIEFDDDDRITPAADTPVTADLQIVLNRVTVEDVTRTVEIPFEKTTKNDSSLAKGTTKVETAGVVGSRTVVETVTTVDGVVESTVEVSSTVDTEPVTQVTLVGTKAAAATSSSSGGGSSSGGSSSGTGLNLANEAMWDKIAQCESSGNWAINTGNGYYGGLQFDLRTWRSVNGQDFAEYPHQASRAEQITVANRLYASRGLQPWSCKP